MSWIAHPPHGRRRRPRTDVRRSPEDPVARFHAHVIGRRRRIGFARSTGFALLGAAALFVATRMSDIGHFTGASAMGLAAFGVAAFLALKARAGA